MQGHRSSLSTLPENFTFDNGSIASNPNMDPQIPWNTLPTPPLNRLASDETNIHYLRHLRHGGQNAEWSFGEGSSSSAQNHQNDRKPEQTWSFRSRNELSNVPSLDIANFSSSDDQTAIPGGSFLLPSHPSSTTFPQDLDISSVFEDDDDDDCQIVERPDIYASAGPSNAHMMPPGSSDNFFMPAGLPGYLLESEDRPGCSSDGRRVSCKRKALGVSVGQSSGAGSSNSYQTADVIPWHTLPASSIPTSNISSGIPSQIDHMGLTQNRPGQANSRLRLGAGGGVSANPFSLTPSGIGESFRRNIRVRLQQQNLRTGSNLFPAEADVGVGNMNPSSSRHSSRLLLRNQLLDLNPLPAVENGTTNGGQFGRRAAQTRWSGASSSRTTRSSASASAFPDPLSFEDSMRRNIPRTISEHPMFAHAGETASTSHPNPINWNHMASGGSGIVGNVASSAGVGSSSAAANSSDPSWPSRNPRRLSEIVRRSLLSSAGVESGNHGLRSSASASTVQEIGLSASDAHGLHTPTSRSVLLGRNLEGVLGTPYSLRTLAAGGEGRSSIMSEQIRHVLNLMRRGEGLRIEDMMLLDHSAILGMAADMQDRHRDMRLDVDNMSYEELLALEERIGNVCTGLPEATIMKHLKQHKFADNREHSQVESEPCSICREEYVDGEDLGRLECGHDFHKDCIKQWLVQKNSCPICKKTGLTT